MSKRSLLLSIGTVALMAATAFAQHPTPPGGEKKVIADDMTIVDRGHAAFKSSCGFCHGDDATGSRAPDLIRSSLVNHDREGELIAPVIRNGRPDKGMPGFPSLKDGDVSDIVTFLHHSAKQALHSGSVSADYPLAKLMTGSAQEGKAYFEGKGGCAGCHSITGDLAGVSKKYSPIDLQQHMVYPGRKVATTATVTATDGNKYEGKVTHNDEFTIAIVAKDGWYHSWPRGQVKVEIHDPLAAHRELMEKYTDADIHNLFAYLVTLK